MPTPTVKVRLVTQVDFLGTEHDLLLSYLIGQIISRHFKMADSCLLCNHPFVRGSRRILERHEAAFKFSVFSTVPGATDSLTYVCRNCVIQLEGKFRLCNNNQ